MRLGASFQRGSDVASAPPPPSAAEQAAPVPHGRPAGTAKERLDSIDLLRGLVMVVMALDHVRDYFTDVRFDPLDLSQTTVPLALTRWITHFCAPVFVFLAGTGAYLSLARGKTPKTLSKFLLTRGLWLVFLEMTVVRFAWEFNFDYSRSFVQVIWAIGWSMIVLSALVHLPSRVVGAFGVVMIALHNLTDNVDPGSLGMFGWPWQILHVFGPIAYAPGRLFFIAYPLIPWIGVMASGFAFGEIFTLERRKRTRALYALGGGLIVLFALLRGFNLYGDPTPWGVQATPGLTLISFLNCLKYPPSLQYLAMTLGPAIALLPLLEKWRGQTAGFFLVFGRVPMFYYVLHIYLIHLLTLGTAAAMGLDVRVFLTAPFFAPPSPGWGFGLPVVYAFWAATVLALYPACRWFAGVKRRRKDPWLSYI